MQPLTYYQRNKAKVLRKARQTRLSTKNGRVYQHLHKRPYPDYCEWCGLTKPMVTSPRHLEYHHWDDNRPSIGLWLCHSCHRVAEFVDNGEYVHAIKSYLALKDAVESHYHEIEPLHSLRWKGK